MNKIVELENLKFCRFTDNAEFIVTDNDALTLTFLSKKYNLSGAIATLINGKIKHFYTLGADGVVTVGKDLLQVGRIDITVNGDKIWIVDGLKIGEITPDLSLEPTLEAMRADLTDKIKTVEQLTATVKSEELQADNALAAAVETLSKQVQEIKVSFDEQFKIIENRLKTLEEK